MWILYRICAKLSTKYIILYDYNNKVNFRINLFTSLFNNVSFLFSLDSFGNCISM